MDMRVLEDLGLSSGEIKTYLALMQLGNTKVGQVIDRAGIASSAVHNALKTLAEKGLVSYVKKGKVKIYRASSPEHMLDYVNEKKERLEEMLPELERMQKAAGERQDAEVFEGVSGLKSMLNLLIEDAEKGDEYLFFVTTGSGLDKDIQDFYLRYDTIRKANGLITLGLSPPELKRYFWNRPYPVVRYVDFPIPTNTSVCNDRIVFFSWENEKQVGYLIRSRQIAEIYRQFFKRVWDAAKPERGERKI